MAALLPLAALTLLATASISGPASVLFRAIRRVVQPTTRPEVPPEETAVAKAANFFSTLLFRSFTSIFALLRVQSPPPTLLPVFRDQGDPIVRGTPITASKTLDEESAFANLEASEVDIVESTVAEEEIVPGPDTATICAAPPPHPQRQQRVSQSRRTYVDFTIGWDDIWPERHCLPHVKYAYNSYFNAYTISAFQEPMNNPPSLSNFDADSDVSSHDTDSEVDALELASRSEDDDLLWAFHSLSISHTSSPPPCSALQQSPPAGMSPFCPPPLPTPSPPQTTTWRLEWY
ncbi:hypothetical protein B0H19DRAFT_1248227 [Mycena capillaripes]|nr:hypothetical protein B0H19DRAFT_1248227 [Mycena capillaripes]